MMRKKITLAAAVAAAVLLGASGCTPAGGGGGGGENPESSLPGPSALADAKGTTEIAVWHAFGAANGEAFTKLIDEFNATNTDNIHATTTFQGTYPDLLAKYTASLRADTAPNLLVLNDVSSGYIVDAGQVIPAADMAKANPDDVDLSLVPPAGTNYYTIDGVQQAVPMGISTPVLWVNRDLLNQAGIDKNTDLSTLDAVVTAAEKVHESTGQFGWTMQDDDWTIENWTSTAGQNFCDPDNGRNGEAPTKITINEGAAKEALSKVVGMYQDGVAVDGAVDGSAAINAFQAGKVAFMPYGSGLNGLLKKGTSFNYEALPFPASDEEFKGNTIVGGAALWLGKTGTPAQQVASWKLESFLTNAVNQEAWSHATGYLPANTDVASSETQESFLSENPAFEVFIAQVEGSPIETNTAGCVTGAMTAIRSSNINELQAAFAGTKTADEALDSAADAATELLKQYKTQSGN
jgi:sn-glycerol 3-phosphate transport system substrate-binding protein